MKGSRLQKFLAKTVLWKPEVFDAACKSTFQQFVQISCSICTVMVDGSKMQQLLNFRAKLLIVFLSLWKF